MSPIRPSLLTLRNRWPKPQQERHVRCPQCGCEVHASRKAISARCPRCTGPLQFQDYTLTSPQQGEVATLGEIHITAACALAGRVICGKLINAGRFQGNAVVHGQVNLEPRSHTTGQLSARSLTVSRGAELHATTQIGPPTSPSKPGQARVANRLIPAEK